MMYKKGKNINRNSMKKHLMTNLQDKDLQTAILTSVN
jgi:hypothetical protein